MEQLTITSKEGTDYILFELMGAFNASTCANFTQKLYTAIKEHNVVLDLSKVIGMDYYAMGIVMAAHNDGDMYDHKLFLMTLSNEVDKVVISTGFKDLFHIINSITEVS